MADLPKSGISLFFPFDALYPGATPSLHALSQAVQRVDRWEGLKLFSRFLWQLLTQFDKPNMEIQRSLVAEAFDRPSYQRLLEFERTNKDAHITVFFRAQVLEAVRWLLTLSGSSPPQEVMAKQDVLAVLMHASHFWGKRLEQAFPDNQQVLAELESSRSIAALASRIGTSQGSVVWHPLVPIARATVLYTQLLPRHFPDFHSCFRESVGVDYDFFLGLQTTFWGLIVSRNDRNPLVTLDDTVPHRLHDAALRYLSTQSQTIDAWTADLRRQPIDPSVPCSLQLLRSRPIIARTERRTEYLILDPVTFVESLTAGPVFSLSTVETRQKALDSLGHAFGDYVSDLLRNVYPESGPGSRLQCNQKIRRGEEEIGEIDAFIDYGHSLIVFEAKASFLSERSISALDPDQFLTDLERRYVGTEEGGPKGVTQLASVTKHYESGLWGTRLKNLSGLPCVYPVLIVHDRAMDNPLTLHHLCRCFQREFGVEESRTLEEIRYLGIRVKNVVIISIDDLEAMEAAIGTLSLLDVLSAFSRENPDRLATFHNFLSGSKYQLRPNRRLNLIAAKTIDRARTLLQGPQPPSAS